MDDAALVRGCERVGDLPGEGDRLTHGHRACLQDLGQRVAVHELEDPHTFESVHGLLRHLIVDEYQDVNPAQERLIRRLATSPDA